MGQPKGQIKTSGSQGNNYAWQAGMLKQLSLLFQRLTGSGGSELISNGTVYTNKLFYSFIVQEDTVLTTLTGGVPPNTSTNYLTSMGLSGKTLKQGALYRVPEGEFITNITVLSGSVIGYE